MERGSANDGGGCAYSNAGAELTRRASLPGGFRLLTGTASGKEQDLRDRERVGMRDGQERLTGLERGVTPECAA